MKAKEFFKKNWIYLLCGTLIISNMFVGLIKVKGTSMTNTYKDKQLVLANKTNKNPKAGDVVICKISSEKNYIKRVIATGGDVVDINYETGEVFVNNVKIIEDYLKDGITKMPVPVVSEEKKVEIDNKENKIYIDGELRYESVKFPFTVSEGCYFVMGDNRLGSFDSRAKNIGEIPQEKIIGVVIGGHEDIIYEKSTNITKKDD